jgi:WW domain-binding protein 4
VTAIDLHLLRRLQPKFVQIHMSEYWVSNKKYYCTYCKIYIADDAPSRQQHENGLRHQGNKERFVRGLYKAGEKRKHDLEEEKREMMRIDQVSLLPTPRF